MTRYSASRGIRVFLLSAILVQVGLPHVWARSGLQTKFGVVTIENLQPGESYNTRELANLPMVIRNSGDEKTTVRIDTLYPDATSPGLVQNGYEVIPSTAWISLSRPEFDIEAGESQGTDIILTIPDDEKLLGKRYQVDFHIRTITTKFIAVGLRANLRFTIAHRKLTAEEQVQRKKVEQYEKVEFDFLPNKMAIENLALGREVELDKEHKQSLKISNPNDAEFLFYLDLVTFRDVDMRVPAGYEELPKDMIVLKEKDVRVKDNSIKKVPLALKVPNEPQYKGKKYAFAVRCRVAGTPVELNQVSRIFVTTQP